MKASDLLKEFPVKSFLTVFEEENIKVIRWRYSNIWDDQVNSF